MDDIAVYNLAMYTVDVRCTRQRVARDRSDQPQRFILFMFGRRHGLESKWGAVANGVAAGRRLPRGAGERRRGEGVNLV